MLTSQVWCAEAVDKGYASWTLCLPSCGLSVISRSIHNRKSVCGLSCMCMAVNTSIIIIVN